MRVIPGFVLVHRRSEIGLGYSLTIYSIPGSKTFSRRYNRTQELDPV